MIAIMKLKATLRAALVFSWLLVVYSAWLRRGSKMLVMALAILYRLVQLSELRLKSQTWAIW